MQILIYTPLDGNDRNELAQPIKLRVEGELSHLAPHITHVEIYLRYKSLSTAEIAEKHCLMEARLQESHPVAATHSACTLEEAINVTLGKLKQSLDYSLRRFRRA
jgi:hypothetical protein